MCEKKNTYHNSDTDHNMSVYTHHNRNSDKDHNTSIPFVNIILYVYLKRIIIYHFYVFIKILFSVNIMLK